MSHLKNALSRIDHTPIIAAACAADIVRYGQRLAKEDANGVDLITTFRAVIPAYLGYLTEQAGSLGATISNLANIPSENEEIDFDSLKSIQDGYLTKEPFFKYTYISQTVVSVPEGFSGHMPDYLKFMVRSIDAEQGVYSMTVNILDDYQAMLSVFLSNKDAKLASFEQRKLIDEAETFVAATKKTFHSFFPTNTGKSKARLGQIFESLTQVRESFPSTAALITHYKQFPIEDIKARVDRCVGLLTLVTEQASGGDSIESISPAVARKLADGAMVIGQLVEFLSAHRYAHHTLITSMMHMYKDLEKTMG